MIGLALGLAIDAGLLLGLVLSGAPVALPADLPRLATIGVSIAALGWTGLPVLVTAFHAAVGIAVRWDAWNRRNDPPAEPPALSEPEPVYTDDAVYRQQRAIDQRNAHWDEFWRRLAQAGNAYGFTQANLTTVNSPTRVMSEPAWNYAIPLMVWAGWLVGGKAGTRWAKERSLALFEAEQGWKVLPHPTDEPPEILPPPYATQQNNTATARNTARQQVRQTPEGLEVVREE